MNFGTWNIQGLNTKSEEVFRELNKLKMDIVVLSETKKKGQGSEMKGNYIHIYSGVDKSKRAKSGVSLAIHKKLKRYIVKWTCYNDRIISITMSLFAHEIEIIGIYAPTDNAAMDIKLSFYEDLTTVVDSISNRKEIILMGDFNGRTGSSITNPVHGRFGENITNENGELLIEFCDNFSLRITNGFFQHKNIHRYTWTQPTRNLQSIIDYIIIRQNTRLKIVDVKVQRGAECGTDHHLLRGRIFFKYKKYIPQQHNSGVVNVSKEIKTFNLESLKHESTQFLYKLRLANLVCNIEDSNAVTLYTNLKTAIITAAKEALGEKPKGNKRN